jgi:uncharacterized SAM-binding protein YcdF (DUF218 family)
MKAPTLVKRLVSIARTIVMLAGLAMIAFFALCFTPLPYRFYSWLSSDGRTLETPPDYVVILGGGGIPSESGLVRTYLGAQVGRQFTNATLIAALPANGNLAVSSADRMKQELVMRGVPANRVVLERAGRNTREQALNTRDIIGRGFATSKVVVVTSPEHMRRALLTFQHAGFEEVYGDAAFDVSLDGQMTYDAAELGGKTLPMPNVGDSLFVRYGFWNNLGYETKSLREAAALLYYKIQGWI